MSFLPPICTPLLKVESDWLSRRLPAGAELWVKDESHCPTGTFKDRLAWEYVARVKAGALPGGPEKIVVSITLGNTMRSFAHAVRRGLPETQQPGLAAIFPHGFRGRTIGPDTNGIQCRGQAVIDELLSAGVICREMPANAGFLDRAALAEELKTPEANVIDVTNGIGTPAYKTIILEALDNMHDPPDHIVVPVGAGVLFTECVDAVVERNLQCQVTGVAVIEEQSIADKIYGYYSPFYHDLCRDGVALYKSDTRFQVLRIEDKEIIKIRRDGLPTGFEKAEPSAWACLVPIADGRAGSGRILVVNTGCGIVPCKSSVGNVLSALKTARSIREKAGFYRADPLDRGLLAPVSVARTIGNLSREHFEAAVDEGLINGIACSRLLLGYDTQPGKERTYDRVSVINGFGSRANANRALQAILAYVLASESLSAEPAMEPSVQLVRKLFYPEGQPAAAKWKAEKKEIVYAFHPAAKVSTNSLDVQVHGWTAPPTIDRAKAHTASNLIGALVNVLTRNGLVYPSEALVTDDRELTKLREEAGAVIREWRNGEGQTFHEVLDPRVLMLATMEFLGPDFVFVAVPLPLPGRLISFYKWAGLWCIMELPLGGQFTSAYFRDYLCTFNLIGRQIMVEMRSYVYRMATWQRKVLSENQESYEALAGQVFLPRVLRQPLEAYIPVPTLEGRLKGIPATAFFAQVPFGEAREDVVLTALKDFLNVQKVGYMSRQKQLIEGILHDLQPRRIDQAAATQQIFDDECDALARRARSLNIDGLNIDRSNARTLAARKAHLAQVRTTLHRLQDTREYVRDIVGANLLGRRKRASIRGLKLGYGFTYDLKRPALYEMSWKELTRFYCNPENLRPLPFSIDRINRAIDALVHNFEKYSHDGANCELCVVEDPVQFAMTWQVSGGQPAFSSFEEFCTKVVTGGRAGVGVDRGVHRGLPLALMFGLESGAEYIGVWIDDGKKRNWNAIVDGRTADVSVPPEGTTYAIRWIWSLLQESTPT